MDRINGALLVLGLRSINTLQLNAVTPLLIRRSFDPTHQRCGVDWEGAGTTNVDNFGDRLTVELQKLQATERTAKFAHNEYREEKLWAPQQLTTRHLAWVFILFNYPGHAL
jgi:hypothetical protein